MAGVIGQVLTVGTFYSPWFPRGGNGASMTLDVIAINGTSTAIQVTVETKNSEDADNEIDASTWASGSVTAVGTDTWTAGEEGGDAANQGFLELVRFKYAVTSSDGWGNVLFRMLNPSWFTN